MLAHAQNFPPGTEFTADVCIVGTGAAGITLAHRLLSMNTNKSILLLESADRDLSGQMTARYLHDLQAHGTYPLGVDLERAHRSYDPVAQLLNRGSGSAELLRIDPKFLGTTRLRAYGGTTNCWGGWTRPLDSIDFDRADLSPFLAWPIGRDALFPHYYNEAMRYCSMESIDVESYDDESFWLKKIPDLELLDLATETGGAMRNGFFLVINAKALDFQTVWGPALEAAPRERCLILRNANVRAVSGGAGCRTVDRLCATTIEEQKPGRDFTIKAQHYVLATGGTESSRLLLASAAGGFANRHDRLGRGFQVHPFNMSFATFTRGANRPPDTLINSYANGLLVPIGPADRQPELRVALAPSDKTLRGLGALDGPMRNFRARIVLSTDPGTIELNWEQTPNADSRVMLGSDKDRYFGDPLAHLEWCTTAADTQETPARAAALLGDLLMSLGYGGELTRSSPPIQWPGDHHMGATAMSRDPHEGYVDKNCKVHGVDNLFIAGSSVFTTSGYANPTLTIIALAARLADHLAGAGPGEGLTQKKRMSCPSPASLAIARSAPSPRRRAEGKQALNTGNDPP